MITPRVAPCASVFDFSGRVEGVGDGERKSPVWGDLREAKQQTPDQTGPERAGLIRKQEKGKGLLCFPFPVHICRQRRQNKGFSAGGGEMEKGLQAGI